MDPSLSAVFADSVRNSGSVTFCYRQQLWLLQQGGMSALGKSCTRYLDLTQLKDGWKDGGEIPNHRMRACGVCYASDGQVLLASGRREDDNTSNAVSGGWMHHLLAVPKGTKRMTTPTPSNIILPTASLNMELPTGWMSLPSWSTLAYDPVWREQPVACIDPATEEMVMIVPVGSGMYIQHLGGVFAFDRRTQTWSARPGLHIPRHHQSLSCAATTSVVVVDGCAGTSDNAFGYDVPLEWYDHRSMKWQQWQPRWCEPFCDLRNRSRMYMVAVEDYLIFVNCDVRNIGGASCYLIHFDPLATTPTVMHALPRISTTLHHTALIWSLPNVEASVEAQML